MAAGPGAVCPSVQLRSGMQVEARPRFCSNLKGLEGLAPVAPAPPPLLAFYCWLSARI